MDYQMNAAYLGGGVIIVVVIVVVIILIVRKVKGKEKK